MNCQRLEADKLEQLVHLLVIALLQKLQLDDFFVGIIFNEIRLD